MAGCGIKCAYIKIKFTIYRSDILNRIALARIKVSLASMIKCKKILEMKQLYKLLFSVLFLVKVTACEDCSVYDDSHGEIPIPVKIDWSTSGIAPSSGNNDDFVHRVSIRFFPKDGSAAFDRYLEGNIFEGEIMVPEGSYSVVVYNEAIDDVYWNDAIRFDNIDDYEMFSANIVEISPLPYDFYTPQPGETFAAEQLKLASWSLDNFEVTRAGKNSKDIGVEMSKALTKVQLRRLVIPIHVVAEVTKLKSAMRMEAALTGIASKVFMASGIPEISPTTHLFAFRSPVWNDETKTDGWVDRKLLTFGRMSQPSEYWIHIGVIFVTGERYTPEIPLCYDVKNQIESPQRQLDIKVSISLLLPEVDSDIGVGDWDDEDHIIQ